MFECRLYFEICETDVDKEIFQLYNKVTLDDNLLLLGDILNGFVAERQGLLWQFQV